MYPLNATVVRSSRTALAAAALAAAGCFGGDSKLVVGAECDEDHPCASGLLCQWGQCRAACAFDRECPDGAYCVAVEGDLAVRVCTFPAESCDEENPCPGWLECLDGVCLNACDAACPGRCVDGVCVEEGSCTRPEHCRLGCACEGGRCETAFALTDGYCATGPDPTERETDIVITTNVDELTCDLIDAACVPGFGEGLSLREALLQAAATLGPHRITVSPALQDRQVMLALGPLPLVPSLTYLQGTPATPDTNGHLTIAGNGLMGDGLVLSGSAIAVSDVGVSHVYGSGVKVAGGSTDVHLLRIRSAQNDEGITIEQGCQRVWIGLGRELRGVMPEVVFYPPGFDGFDNAMSSYAWNVVASNSGAGIAATGVSHLRISGTSVGFDPVQSPAGGPGNGGVGIELHDVDDAVVGAQRLTDEEVAGLSWWLRWSGYGDDVPAVLPADPFQTFVVTGWNGGGGIVVDGGGEIALPGLFVGAPVAWVPTGDNEVLGVDVRNTTGRVSIGPSVTARGDEGLLFSFVFTRTAPAIRLSDTGGPVTVRGIQIVHDAALDGSGAGRIPSLVTIASPTAPVTWLHSTIFNAEAVTASLLSVEDVTTGNVEIVNSVMWSYDTSPTIAAAAGSAPPPTGMVSLRGNLRIEADGPWCDFDCGVDPETSGHLAEAELTETCIGHGVVNVSAGCVMTDLGVDTGFDVNGSLEGDFTGCGPDPGAFECITDECAAVTCD